MTTTFARDLDQCPQTAGADGAGRCTRRTDHTELSHRTTIRGIELTFHRNLDQHNYAPDPLAPDTWAWCCEKSEPCPDHGGRNG